MSLVRWSLVQYKWCPTQCFGGLLADFDTLMWPKVATQHRRHQLYRLDLLIFCDAAPFQLSKLIQPVAAAALHWSRWQSVRGKKAQSLQANSTRLRNHPKSPNIGFHSLKTSEICGTKFGKQRRKQVWEHRVNRLTLPGSSSSCEWRCEDPWFARSISEWCMITQWFNDDSMMTMTVWCCGIAWWTHVGTARRDACGSAKARTLE